MKWTDHIRPNKHIPYDHVSLKTPLGYFIITWKSWKPTPSYDIEINDKCIGSEYSLDVAKDIALKHLAEKTKELKSFLNNHETNI